MKKVFISQPMAGKDEHQIRKERTDIMVKYADSTDAGATFIDSVISDMPPASDCQGLWFLGESLKIMSGADVVLFAPGWQSARGCRIEHQAAEAYGLQIVEM